MNVMQMLQYLYKSKEWDKTLSLDLSFEEAVRNEYEKIFK